MSCGKKHFDILNRFDVDHECDGRTDRQNCPAVSNDLPRNKHTNCRDATVAKYHVSRHSSVWSFKLAHKHTSSTSK